MQSRSVLIVNRLLITYSFGYLKLISVVAGSVWKTDLHELIDRQWCKINYFFKVIDFFTEARK